MSSSQNLEAEAIKHLDKCQRSLDYHEGRLQSDIPQKIKYAVQAEIDMLKFMRDYARESLRNRGIEV